MKIIETKLSEKEFINANMVLLYKKRGAWINIVIGGLLLIYFLFTWFESERTYFDPTLIIAPVILIGLLPLLTYFRAKKLFGNSRAGEKIIYEFRDNQFVITGESFNSQLSWDKIYKVTGTKNWIFVWHNSQQANPIPKKDIWEGEILKLREILDTNKVKNNLA